MRRTSGGGGDKKYSLNEDGRKTMSPISSAAAVAAETKKTTRKAWSVGMRREIPWVVRVCGSNEVNAWGDEDG